MFRKTVLFALALTMLSGLASAMTLDEIVAKAVEARGGRDALLAVKTVKITGKVHMPNGMEAPLVWEWKRPNKLRSEVTIQGMKLVQAFDGTTAWMIMPFRGNTDPQEMPKEQAQRMEEQADFDGPFLDGATKGYKLELIGKVDEEGTEAYKIKVTNKFGDVTYYYLDTDYFLPFKEEGKRTIRGQEIEFESSIGDYKKVGGLLIPFSTESKAKGSQQGQSVTFDKVVLNVNLDDSLFAKPAPKPTPAPATAEGK
ncbi:MAG: hypothetical protein GXP47_08230 [Acidobacteria bacterium]|nr:hypothetical protein [Acidobacteriota bacterium]